MAASQSLLSIGASDGGIRLGVALMCTLFERDSQILSSYAPVHWKMARFLRLSR